MRERGFNEKRLQLLCDITGAFRPGVLTALMGVSGAGKTTLMDVLSGRKTGGTIEGDIRISGYPKVQKTFARISGYCEQTDIHSPHVTVEESVVYSAWLRLPPEIDRQTKSVRDAFFSYTSSTDKKYEFSFVYCSVLKIIVKSISIKKLLLKVVKQLVVPSID